jgi:hypothetical protein
MLWGKFCIETMHEDPLVTRLLLGKIGWLNSQYPVAMRRALQLFEEYKVNAKQRNKAISK